MDYINDVLRYIVNRFEEENSLIYPKVIARKNAIGFVHLFDEVDNVFYFSLTKFIEYSKKEFILYYALL